jgi:hypothetical protein
VKGHITHVQEVISEVLLDNVALVTTADYKLIDAVGTKDLENMPQDWPAADFHHRLGPQVRFLGDPGAEAAGKDYRFHGKA